MKSINFILISTLSIFNILIPAPDISEARKKETIDERPHLLRYEFTTSRKTKRIPPDQDLDTAIELSSRSNHQEEIKIEDGYLFITRAQQCRPTSYNFAIETATIVWLWGAISSAVTVQEIVMAGASGAALTYAAVSIAKEKITGKKNSDKPSNKNNNNNNGSNNDNDPKKPKNNDPIVPSDQDRYAPKSGFTTNPSKPNGTYENNPKHHQNSSGNISKPPKDGQACLDRSVETTKKDVRVAVEDKKYVVLREHRPGEYHGYATENWNDLHWTEQQAFCEGGLVRNAKNGRLVK